MEKEHENKKLREERRAAEGRHTIAGVKEMCLANEGLVMLVDSMLVESEGQMEEGH